MIVLLLMAALVWFIWGAAFDPKDGKDLIENEVHKKRWKRLISWIDRARDVLADPTSTKKERERALRDIEVISRYLKERA